MAIKARDIMTGGAECVGANDTLEQAARKMKSSTSARFQFAVKTTG